MWFVLHVVAACAALLSTTQKREFSALEISAFCVRNLDYVLPSKVHAPPAKHALPKRVFSYKQKQARVNLMLEELMRKGITIENATQMLQVYEKNNVQWMISNQEFCDMVKAFGKGLGFATQACLLLLWRKTEFQTLIQRYV